jgi:hypothetical protein
MPDIGLDVTTGQPTTVSAVVERATDPIAVNVVTPGDFAAQFPTPLDHTEILDMCEDISLFQNIPEIRTSLKEEHWREMTALAFASGSNYIAFADGTCPEEYAHEGSNTTVVLKNIGAKKSLTISDILHSMASIAAGWGINALMGGYAAGEGLPGASDATTFTRAEIASLKVKEIRLSMALVMNAWDRLLAGGNATSRPLEFDGMEALVVPANGAHTNTGSSVSGMTVSGSFSAIGFDRFLSETCAKPTHVFGHPQAIQEMLAAYFQLGFQGSQIITNVTQSGDGGNRIIPGFNFAGFVNTSIGRLTVVSDVNFTRTDMGNGAFASTLYALRMQHNGMPLVYRATQIPLSLVDLVPGCTSVSFEIWAKTALVIKQMCAMSAYRSVFNGRTYSGCTILG